MNSEPGRERPSASLPELSAPGALQPLATSAAAVNLGARSPRKPWSNNSKRDLLEQYFNESSGVYIDVKHRMAPEPPELDHGWHQYHSDSGRSYYVNHTTHQSQWEFPYRGSRFDTV